MFGKRVRAGVIWTALFVVTTFGASGCTRGTEPGTSAEQPIYFPEAMEYPFGYEILGPSESPDTLCTSGPGHACSIVATYLNRTPYESSLYTGQAFHFNMVGSGEPMTLTVRSGYANRVHLVPDTTYRLIAQGVLGWPDTFGLVIKEDDALVFLGLSDWELERTLSIGCLSPIGAEQVRVLADHYREGRPCYGRFINTEIAFAHDGESILLHQGQSATLGDYEINLDIARTIDHYFCPDAGANNISFTISRAAPGDGGLAKTESGSPTASEEIDFPDPALEWFIRGLIYKDSGPIFAADLQHLGCFLRFYPLGWSPEDAPNQGQITDLTGLEHAANLTAVFLSGSSPTDLAPLANLTNLTRLYVDHSELDDLSPLSGLINLTHLWIDSNRVSDLSPLSALTNLRELYARDNQIADLSALSALTGLSRLNLNGNSIIDLSPLSPLINLDQLSLYNNQITDVSPLAALITLTDLSLEFNGIVDVAPLSALVNLSELKLQDNQIADIAPLSALVNLTHLSLDDNQIADIAPLSALVNLNDLRLGSNQIKDISALAHLTELRIVDLSGNQITDISPLVENAGLGEGDHVSLAGNPLSADAVDTQVQQLISRGVTVW
jgi:Leucine-rich repeat (LRR) protein